MIPKTQSVCKHCQQPIKLNVGVWIEVGKERAGVYCPMHWDSTQQHGTGFHEPVSEPASTGEPPACPCPCHKGESVICNCGGGFECEYINSIRAARPSEPVSGDAPLRISFDIGGVLSKYPEVFRPMVYALQRGGAEVFVITDMHEREKSVRFVRDNGYDIPSERILNSDYTAHGEGCKAETIKQHSIKIHLDDFAGYCAHMECVSLFVWPNPTKPYYADDFKTDGTEGDFGRRKAAKI